MGLIELIIILAVIGFLLWAVLTFIPLEPTMRKLLVGVVVVVVVLWILEVIGLLPDVQIPTVR